MIHNQIQQAYSTQSTPTISLGTSLNSLPLSQQVCYTTPSYDTATTFALKKPVEYDDNDVVYIHGRLRIVGDNYFKNEQDNELTDGFQETFEYMIIQLLKEKYQKFNWIYANQLLTTNLVIKNISLQMIIEINKQTLYIQCNDAVLLKCVIGYNFIEQIIKTATVLTRHDLLEGFKNL